MTTELDKLIFTLDADTTPLKAKFVEAEAQAAASGQKISKALSSPFLADTQAGSAQLLKMRAAVDSYTDGLKKVPEAGASAAAGVEKVTAAVTKSHGATSTAVREFRALFDELSSGRTRQTPGTLAIIATRVLGIGAASLAASAAILGIPIAAAIAADKSRQSFAALENSIKATGSAAGLTLDQANKVAVGIAGSSNYSTQGAREALGTAFRGGLTGSRAGGAVALAPDFAAGTGTDAKAALDTLIKDLKEPGKNARELADQFHVLSAAQVKQIEDLDQQGQTEKAADIALKALTDRFHGMNEEAEGFFGKLGDAIKKGFSSASDFLYRAGGPHTLDERIQDAQGAVNSLSGDSIQMRMRRTQSADGGAGALAQAQNNLDLLQAQKFAQDQSASDQKQADAAQSLIERGTDLAKAFDLVDEKTRSYTNSAKLLAEARVKAKTYGADPDTIKTLTAAAAAASAAAKNQQSSGARAAQPYLDRIAAANLEPAQRSDYLARAGIQQQYRNDLSNPATAGYAGTIRADATKANQAERTDLFSDAYSGSGVFGQTAFANRMLRGQANASSQGPAALTAAREKAEAASAAQPFALASNNADEDKKVKELTDDLQREYEVRDKLNQQIQINGEDRQLQQQIDLQKLEIDLSNTTAGQRAKELSDLRTKQQLEDEGLTGKELDDELTKRKALNETLALGTVKLQQIQKAQQQFAAAENQITSAIGDAFASAIQNGNNLRGVWQGLEQDIEKILIKLTVTQPLENALNQIMPNPGGVSGGIGAAGYGYLTSLFSSSASNPASGAAYTGASFAGDGFSVGGGTQANRPIVVGENGPEIFTPNSPGSVMANGASKGVMGNGHTINVTQVVSMAADPTAAARAEFFRQLPQLKAATISGVSDALNRGQIKMTAR